MIIKLKDKKIKVPKGICFKKEGYDEDLIEEINSGGKVKVDKIPPTAKELISEIKPNKETK